MEKYMHDWIPYYQLGLLIILVSILIYFKWMGRKEKGWFEMYFAEDSDFEVGEVLKTSSWQSVIVMKKKKPGVFLVKFYKPQIK